jgi:hypothetical protein
VQLYQLRSARSWGIGDYADLRTLARELGARGADVLLVNPVHAVTPVLPIQPSPYFPSSRRFADQLGVAVDALPEYEAAPAGVRARVDALRPPSGRLIDRDAVWTAKRAAFALLRPPGEPLPAEVDWTGVDGFAVFCALAEQHGADWRAWPARCGSPVRRRSRRPTLTGSGCTGGSSRRAVEQLDAAQQEARDAGMAVGIVHDLAVGVDPAGADAWLLPGDLATGATVGAPPDPFSQLGQDWGFPPFRPGRLAETAYRPFRQVVRAALEHGGGLRVDHVMGLFRLWWVPAGLGAVNGTYVSYDHAAMLRVLVLEAARAGAMVVGEDLGTVEPEVRLALDDGRGAGVVGALVHPGGGRDHAAAAATVAGAGGGERVHARPADRVRVPRRRAGAGAGRARPARPAGRGGAGQGAGGAGTPAGDDARRGAGPAGCAGLRAGAGHVPAAGPDTQPGRAGHAGRRGRRRRASPTSPAPSTSTPTGASPSPTAPAPRSPSRPSSALPPTVTLTTLLNEAIHPDR